MSVFAWLLWTLFGVIVAGPVQRATWSEGEISVLTDPAGAPRPAFFQLPMFRHAPRPLIAPELFRPVHRKRPLPARLTALLLPPARQPQSVQETDPRAVEVWCGVDRVSVRVDRFQLRAWTEPSLFRLGSCQASRVSPRFLYFHYGLTECGGDAEVVGGQLVYTFSLRYTPPRQGPVLRVVPLNFPIYCQYNRFHYSYQVGFRPNVQHTTFRKSLKTKLSFSLTVCNAEWEPLPPGHWFSLGERVYFMVQTGGLLDRERLYVDSCHATSSRDPDSTPRLDIISNYGCMIDSRREGSSSQFLSRGANALKFSVDAFLFQAGSQMLYLHCSVSVGLTTSFTSKSCNYNRAAGRWEELRGPPSVCSCCDSVCTGKHHSLEYTVSSSGWHTGQNGEEREEEGRDWLYQGVNREERWGEHFQVPTFPMEPESGLEEKEEVLLETMSQFPDDETEWRHTTTDSHWREKERESDIEDVIVEQAELRPYSNIMSDESRPQENVKAQAEEEVPSAKADSVTALSSNNSSSKPSRVGSATTTVVPRVTTRISSFAVDDYDTSNHGFDESVSSAVVSVIKACPDADKSSCVPNAAVKPESGSDSAGHSTKYSDASAVSLTSGTSRSGSASDSSVHDSRFDGGLETFVRTIPATTTLEVDLPGFDVRELGKRRLELDQMNTFLSEQLRPVNKSVKTRSDRIPQPVGDSVSSKGADGDVLHSLQIRGLESDQSAHPPGLSSPSCVEGKLCEADFDSGIEEDEALHLSQFTGAVKMEREVKDISGTIPRTHSVSYGSVSLEQMHQDSPSHSAVVAVSTPWGSDSHQMTDGEWAEVVPRWGLHSFRFVVEQPTETFNRR